MKKILLALGLALLSYGSAHAAKAWPYPITVIQSNGEPITVFLHGDEHFHWYTDAQGNILTRTGNDFTKLDVDPSTFVSQGIAKAQTRAVSREAITKTPTVFPFTGSPRAIVILAEYPDRKFTVSSPRASFEQYLNGSGHPVDLGLREDLNYGSVKQYFIDQSYGAYSPQFDVYGPVMLPNNMAYYGGAAGNGNDEKATQLVIDACKAMDDSLDFSRYDQDGDGNADLVYVVYAGYGQSSGASAETMWPKSFNGFSKSTAAFDGKGVNRCGISNELMAYEGAFDYTTTDATQKNFDTAVKRINGIGLFVHEFSHCLGLPDFYTTNQSTANDNQGMEDWSIMDNGTYVSNGNVPTAYTAWEREAMGWDKINVITEAKQYQLTAAKGQRAVKVVNPGNVNEYYVFEIFEDKGWNQRIARNSTYNPTTSGLLVYHVDYNATSFSLASNSVNNTIGHPRMTVIPADGRLVSSYRLGDGVTDLQYYQSLNGDIFRVDDTVNFPTFSQDGDLPNASWWTSAAATPIYNINYTNGSVYFDFRTPIATTGIQQSTTPDTDAAPSPIYTLDGRYVGTSVSALPRGIYVRGGKKFVK